MSMFQKRHYVAVARLIRNRVDAANTFKDSSDTARLEIDRFARDFETLFRSDNANFKPDRFYKACGISA